MDFLPGSRDFGIEERKKENAKDFVAQKEGWMKNISWELAAMMQMVNSGLGQISLPVLKEFIGPSRATIPLTTVQGCASFLNSS